MKWWKYRRNNEIGSRATFEVLNVSAQNRAELRTLVNHLRYIVESGGLTPIDEQDKGNKH